jgi:autotransporter-associated beta strand protein
MMRHAPGGRLSYISIHVGAAIDGRPREEETMAARIAFRRLLACGLAAVLAMHAGPRSAALAQSTWLPTSGTTPWTTGTAWSGGLIPDGVDAVAVFPAAGPTVLLDDTTVTVGTITQTSTSGNVVIGSTGAGGSSTDVVNLAVSTGVPVVNVSGGNMFMYAQLTGTQGLRKNGGGVYSPRYNTLDFTYTGTNFFGGGTVQIARDGQLGDAANPIEVLASTGLQNFGGLWTSTRPIAITSGTLTLQHGAATNVATLGGAISGTGGLSIVTGNFTLSGPVSYGGSTLIRSATVSLTGGGLLSTAPLSLQTSATNTGGSLVDFGGGSQTVSSLALTLASGGTMQVVNTFRNGTLSVTGGNLNVNSGATSAQSGTTQLDLKGLSAFAWGNGTGNLVLNTTSTVASSTATTIMSLPTSGSSSLTAAHVQIANSTNGPASSTSILQLGLANAISTGTLTVGAYRGNGIVAFAPEVSGGSLVLRGPTGGDSRVDNVYVGFKSGGDNFGNGSIDVSSGSIDARVANLAVGYYYAFASAAQSSTFTMASGTVNATTLSLGVMAVPTGTGAAPVMTNRFTQSGGTVQAGALLFGVNATTSGTNNNPSFRGTYTLAGGTLAAATISSGTGPSAATSQRRLAWTGGVITSPDGSTDLAVTGKSGVGGAILFELSGADPKSLDVPSGRTATFGQYVTMSGSDTSFTKTGDGTLVLGGEGFTTSYGGSTTVAAGRLVLHGDQSAATGPLQVNAGATLGGSGTFGGVVTVDAGATFSPGSSPGTLAFTQGLTWNPGTNYNWQMLSGTGVAGAADAWDLIQVGGGLTIAATSLDPFRVNLWTLSGVLPDVSGTASNFDPAQNHSWTIATAAGGITGFAADKFLISTSATNGTGGFANALGGGTFSIAQSGNDLNLVFTAGTPTVITIDVASGTQTQTQAGYPTLAGSTPVVKTGGGTLVLDQANTLTGSTTVQGGVVQLANASALSTSRLVVVAGGTGQLAPFAATSVAGLDLATGNGLMDVTNGSLTIASGMTAPQLVAELLEGRADGSWTGTSGITSSTAAADIAASQPRAVGWLDNGDGSFTVAYAAPGDTNIDWSIDILDASNFLALGKFDTGLPATWVEGDFSYDGIVDILDAADFFATGLYDAGNYNAAPGAAGGVAAVPEPAMWSLLGAGLAAAATCRRRR